MPSAKDIKRCQYIQGSIEWSHAPFQHNFSTSYLNRSPAPVETSGSLARHRAKVNKNAFDVS